MKDPVEFPAGAPKRMCALVCIVASMAFSLPASATVVLNPGAGVSLAGSANLGGTVLNDITTAFSAPLGLFTGTLRTLVVRETGGTLDFYYQITNTTADPSEFLDGITVRDFPGFATSVDWSTNGLTGITGAGAFSIGTTAPDFATRDLSPADDITFFFPFGTQNSSPAQNPSAFMFVKTDATAFSDGEAIISGAGFTAPVRAFAPVSSSSVVPEPASGLIGLATALVALFGATGRHRTARD